MLSVHWPMREPHFTLMGHETTRSAEIVSGGKIKYCICASCSRHIALRDHMITIPLRNNVLTLQRDKTIASPGVWNGKSWHTPRSGIGKFYSVTRILLGLPRFWDQGRSSQQPCTGPQNELRCKVVFNRDAVFIVFESWILKYLLKKKCQSGSFEKRVPGVRTSGKIKITIENF